MPSLGGGGRESEVSGNIKSWDGARPRLEEDYFALIWDERAGEPISISLCLLLHITNLTDYWQTPVWLVLLHFTRWHPAAHPSCWADTCRVKRLNGPFHEFSNKTCLMFENNQCFSILGSGPSITPHTSAPSDFNLEADFTRRLRLRRGSCDLACAEAFVGSFLTSWLLEYPGCCHFNCC